MIFVAFQKEATNLRSLLANLPQTPESKEIPQVSASTALYQLWYQRQRGMFSKFDVQRVPSQAWKPGEEADMWGLFRGPAGRRLNDRARPWLDILHALRQVRWRAVSFGRRDRITKASSAAVRRCRAAQGHGCRPLPPPRRHSAVFFFPAAVKTDTRKTRKTRRADMWPADGEPLHSGRSYKDHEKHDRKLQITAFFPLRLGADFYLTCWIYLRVKSWKILSDMKNLLRRYFY